MASLLDVCRFTAAAGSTTDWAYSSAVTGYQSPAAAGVVNGATYKYRAESSDLSQWEVGEGTYNTGTNVLSRTTILFNSSGTTTKINFTAAPQVAIVALAEDFPVRTAATQSDQETSTNNGVAVTPAVQQFHPSAVKAWVRFNASSGTPTIISSYNVTSLTDNGVGDTTINFTVPFSSANYCPMCWGDVSTAAQGTGRWIQYIGVSTTQFRILTTSTATTTGEDWDMVCVQIFGDQ